MLSDASFSYTYDAENRTTSGAGVNYTYDGDGRRVQKSTGKLYWYGTGSDPLAESDAVGNFTDEYIFFGGKRITGQEANSDSTSTITYYFADQRRAGRVCRRLLSPAPTAGSSRPAGPPRAIEAPR